MKNKNTIQKKWFTLVELIVVITILAILWTIVFISLQQYNSEARDSVRISDLSNIIKSLELKSISWKVPIPDDKIDITASGVIISYQWYAGKKTLDLLWIFNWWKDPLDDKYYTYTTDKDLNRYQVLWYLENWTIISRSLFNNDIYAADLSKRFITTKWKQLWILLQTWSNAPAQDSWIDIDIFKTTNEYKVYVTNDFHTQWTWTWRLQFMAQLNRADWLIPPKKCDEWFIPVIWNKDFNQPWFCVAKYEMSYHWIIWTSFQGTSWNTYSFQNDPLGLSGSLIVSEPNNSPIVFINEVEAVKKCRELWPWYHLITNNEWMTIARNIESQWKNWSSWTVWNGYIYEWVWVKINGRWCPNQFYDNLTNNWTVTWDSNCNWKNELVLSNWEKIWDFAWNIRELVKNEENIDWQVGDQISTNGNFKAGQWDIVGNDYRLLYGPLLKLNENNWVWYTFWLTANSIFRWGRHNSKPWIYSLIGTLDVYDSRNPYTWFRCAK